LISDRGAHGGYMLGRDLARLSFQELSEILLGKVAIARCIAGAEEEGSCEMRGSCNIVSPVQMLNRKLNEFYRALSVAELLGTPRAAATTAKKTEAEV
jgi:DNA-binding IscR family transcriptional regulator